MEVSEVDCAGVYLANKDGGLDMVAHRGLSPEFVKAATHFHAQLALACLPATGKSASSPRQRLPAPLDEAVRREGMTAWAIVPVYNNSQLVGTVNLGSRREHEIPLWSRHAIEGFASHVGEAIARLAAEKGMRETQTNLQSLFDSMDDFAFVLDYDGRILHVNRLVRERLGYSAEELRDMPMSNLHPADRQDESLEILVEVLMASKTVVSTVPLVTRAGTSIPVETTWTRSRWSNREVPLRHLARRDRADARRTRVGGRLPRGRSRQRGEDRVPGQHVPRTANAVARHPQFRHLRPKEITHRPRRHAQGILRPDPTKRHEPPHAGQRPVGPLQAGSRQDGLRVPARQS